MAQTMMLMPSVSGHSVDLRTPRLRPTSSSFSRSLLYNPLPSPAASSHRSSPVFALFKSKTKAPPKKVVKEKPKVEDGVFGTSGGIGFTKENELFVGRVAMIGFAVSSLSFSSALAQSDSALSSTCMSIYVSLDDRPSSRIELRGGF
ncbi:hypothetical protein EUGRSUZ_F03789 [Eucalyptus grandis]|uniref:Uncharacterized protein n=2 Tax=Eucalyptus grandis TaxID=71139 RepID=A0ACC3KNJ5_EUCGR|nr:hypothetical protein EUGRSUZ_F03789 [Eucalyptus grandis]